MSNLSEKISLLEKQASQLPALQEEQQKLSQRLEAITHEIELSVEAIDTLSRLETAFHGPMYTALEFEQVLDGMMLALENVGLPQEEQLKILGFAKQYVKYTSPESTETTSIEQTPLAVAEQEPTPEQATPDAPASPAPAGFENLTNPEAILAFLDQHPGTYFSNAEITDGLAGWGRTMGSVSTYMSQLHSKRKVIRRYRDTDDILEYSQLVPEAGPELQEVATLTGVYAAIMKAVHQRPNETASNNLSRVKAHYPALTLEDIKIKLSELERSGWVEVDQTGSLARYTARQQYIDRGRA